MISEGKFVCSHAFAGCGTEFLTKKELVAHKEACVLKKLTMAKPLLILDLKANLFNRDAINSVLDKVGDCPFVVFCVSGPAREGKSYFLNQWLKYAAGQHPNYTGFLSKAGIDPVTQGIHLWSEPLIQLTPRGEIVLLIDTQGLGDMETTARQNAMLFTFSCSLASVMIHNQFSLPNKLIELTALTEFDCYSNLAQGVLESFNREKSAEKIALASKLLFLRRDFKPPSTDEYALGLHSENEKPDGSKRNFYQDVFHGRSTGSEQQELLKNIQKHFPHISTYLLPAPGEQFPKTDPTAEFTEHMKSLVKMLMSKNYFGLAKKTTTKQSLFFGKYTTTLSGTQFKEIVASLEVLFKSNQKYFVEATTKEELKANGLLMDLINFERETWRQEADALLGAHKAGASDEVLQKFVDKFSTRVTSKLRDLGLKDKFPKQWSGFCEDWFANLKKRNDLQAYEYFQIQIKSERMTWRSECKEFLRSQPEGASDEELKDFFNTFCTGVESKFRDMGLGDQFVKQWTKLCGGWYATLKERNELQANNSLVTQVNSKWETWISDSNALLRNNREGMSDKDIEKHVEKHIIIFKTVIRESKHSDPSLRKEVGSQVTTECLYADLKERNESFKKTAGENKIKRIVCTVGAGVAVGAAAAVALPVVGVAMAVVAAGGFVGGAGLTGTFIALTGYFSNNGANTNEDQKWTKFSDPEEDKYRAMDDLSEDEEDDMNAAKEQQLLSN